MHLGLTTQASLHGPHYRGLNTGASLPGPHQAGNIDDTVIMMEITLGSECEMTRPHTFAGHQSGHRTSMNSVSRKGAHFLHMTRRSQNMIESIRSHRRSCMFSILARTWFFSAFTTAEQDASPFSFICVVIGTQICQFSTPSVTFDTNIIF